MPRKKIFHDTREPSATFELNSKIYSGHLVSFWDNGLEIHVQDQLYIEPGMAICNICLGDDEKVPSIERMQVLQVLKIRSSTVIEMFNPDKEDTEKLKRVLHFLREVQELESFDTSINRSRIPKFSTKAHYTRKAINERLLWARKVSGSKLQNVAETILKPESLAGNIENYIGAVQIPIGLAGPVLLKGTYTDGYIPLPIATTEGALVSSISRGAKACSLAGGIHVHVMRQHMLRAPVFFCKSLEGAVTLERWILQHITALREKAESVSSIAKLEKILPLVFGNALHLRFYFTTGDAAGQNMTSACTWVACEWIAEEIKNDPFIEYLWYNIEANMSGDKKANSQNFIEGRGLGVTATCFVPGKILKRILRVTPEQYVRIWSEGEFAANQIGMIGSNINFANVVAGIFTATGQDIACVHESAGGVFKACVQGDGLVFTAYLPSLVAGTVGGGTKLPVQKECLELMGCYGPGKLFRFAEIITATCLALDISTGAAIVTNDFVSAHERLGRNRPTNKISWSEINEKFFTDLFDEPKVQIIKMEKIPRLSCSGIISTITGKSSNVYGLHRYMLTAETSGGKKNIPAFLKLKASGRELMEIGFKVAKLTGEDHLPGLYESQSHIFCLEASQVREIQLYREADPELLKYCPGVYGTKINNQREIYAILMEDLTDCSYYDSINTISQWDEQSIKTVLFDMASMHAVYFDSYDGLGEMNIERLEKNSICSSSELLNELTLFNTNRYPELIHDDTREIYMSFLDDLENNLMRMLSFPMTLTHNDFNPRNLCLRRGDESPATVLYDWELAFFQNPQHDLIEFLVFVLKDGSPRKEYIEYATFYLKRLEEATGRSFTGKHFFEVLDLNAVFFALVRMNLYLLGNNILKLAFLDRVYSNLTGYIVEAYRTPDK